MKRANILQIRKATVKDIVLTCLIIIGITFHANALVKEKDAEKVSKIESTLRTVAENILRKTSFKIINKETRETFDNSDHLPVSNEYNIESGYNAWKYWNGVLNIGFIEMGKTLADDRYIDYAKKNVDFVFDHQDYFRKRYEAGNCPENMSQWFRLSMLDDCGAMGASIVAVHQLDKQKRYRDYLDIVDDYMMNKEHRLDDGTFCRTEPYEMTIWGDDLYMSVPYLARMGDLTGETRFFDEAAKQVINFNKYLWDPNREIYYHCYYSDIKRQGTAHWGRCNGWIIVAQVELLDKLPKNHPKRELLLKLLSDQISGLCRYQDVSGLWHQLLDIESTFLETSCTAMFTYAIAKAVNEKWIPRRYAVVAAKGWDGVQSKITEKGDVEGICCGTCTSTSNRYYVERATPTNDIHGIGAIFLAGSEVIKMLNSGDIYDGCIGSTKDF